MAHSTPWTVFCPIARFPDFVKIEPVTARTEEEAVALARRRDDAPLYPIVCHPHPDPEGVIIDRPGQIETDRRNRRRTV